MYFVKNFSDILEGTCVFIEMSVIGFKSQINQLEWYIK